MTGSVTLQIRRRCSVDQALPKIPHYATSGSSGLDLCADLSAPVEIPSMGRKLIPTGIFIALPPGYEAQIRPRSGLALKHGITVLNAPGTIDSDYRGEIQIILANLGVDSFWVQPGDRIAQMVIAGVCHARFEEVGELPQTGRNEGGFGHTGK